MAKTNYRNQSEKTVHIVIDFPKGYGRNNFTDDFLARLCGIVKDILKLSDINEDWRVTYYDEDD